MKYLLTSAGITNDKIADALAALAGKPLCELSILFVPTAANTEKDDKRWLIENLTDIESQGFKLIDILDVAAVSDEIWKPRFFNADIICVGGGNEKYLASLFSKIGMKEFLTMLPDNKVYMGISAGSMVTGHFIPNELYGLVYPEENFSEPEKHEMMLQNLCFIPHLNSNFFQHVRKKSLDSLDEKFTKTVYAMDDETALAIDGNQPNFVGTGEYWSSIK